MLAEKLKQFRKENKLTQHQLAEKLKISPSVVAGVENKSRNGSLQFLKMLSEFSGKPLSYWVESDSIDSDSVENVILLRELLNMLHYKKLDKEVKIKLGDETFDIDCITENHKNTIYIKAKSK